MSAGLLFAVVVLAGGSLQPRRRAAAKPKCFKAEVNPVTGHVCIDPLGAAVEPPPPEAALQEAGRGEGPVELSPNCMPEVEGM